VALAGCGTCLPIRVPYGHAAIGWVLVSINFRVDNDGTFSDIDFWLDDVGFYRE
jgi:hypothetical protein